MIGSGTNSLHNRANDFSAFFQDDWKVAPRLTLNLGLRYDYFGPTTETDGHFVGFDPSKAATTPLLIPGFGSDCPAVPSTCGWSSLAASSKPAMGTCLDSRRSATAWLIPTTRTLGRESALLISWADSGNLVLRGGYGIFYDRPNMRLYNIQLFNMPYEMMAIGAGHPERKSFCAGSPTQSIPADPQHQSHHLPIWRISGLFTSDSFTVRAGATRLSRSGHRDLSRPARLELSLTSNPSTSDCKPASPITGCWTWAMSVRWGASSHDCSHSTKQLLRRLYLDMPYQP